MSIASYFRSWMQWLIARRSWRRIRREQAERAAHRAAWLATTGALRRQA